jgi:drug/metabolite transporter (DMT)-like permease
MPAMRHGHDSMTAPDTQKKSDGILIAYLMLTVVALLWAANTNVARATTQEVPPIALTFWRLFLSALIFAPFAFRNTWRNRRVVLKHFWFLNLLALYKRPPELSLLSFMFLSMAFASIHVFPFFLVEHIWFRALPMTQTALLTVGFIALFPSVLAQTFFVEGVRRIGPAKAGYMIYLTPVFGVFMAVAVLGEPFRNFHIAGIAMIAFGIWLATFSRKKT